MIDIMLNNIDNWVVVFLDIYQADEARTDWL